CDWVLKGIYVYDRALNTFQMRVNLFFDIIQEHGEVIRMPDSKEKVHAYIKTLREVHEYNLEIFKKYIPPERRGWWVEKTDKEQVISDIAKMLHDLAVIYTNIMYEMDEFTHPAIKDMIYQINSERSQFVKLYMSGDILNIQALTGHSVKVDLSDHLIYGHIGDHYPIEDIDVVFQRKYDINKNPDKFKELVLILADAVTLEQQMRDKIMYLEDAISTVIENLPAHMDEESMNPFILIQRTGRERFNRLIDSMKKAKELVNELNKIWHEYAMSNAMKLSDFVVGTLQIQNRNWYDTFSEKSYLPIVMLFVNNDLSIDMIYEIYKIVFPWG
ncbi:MAG: hypothetical protein QXK74_07405, partial [Candidatus Nitrosocaldaceae archaeon]